MKDQMKVVVAGFIVMAIGIFMFGFTIIGLFLLCADCPITLEMAGLIGLISIVESAAIAGWYELSKLIRKWVRTQRDRGY